MIKSSAIGTTLMALWALVAAGCAGIGGPGGGAAVTPAEVREAGAGGATAGGAGAGAQAAGGEVSAAGLGEEAPLAEMRLDDPDSPLAQRTVYFDFDSAEVRPDYQPMLEAHARFLAANPDRVVTLEGHTDERGSREYNLALGERRAQAVRRLLVLLGASAEQIRVVSYGEERPAVEGHDEAAWARNRRVELVY